MLNQKIQSLLDEIDSNPKTTVGDGDYNLCRSFTFNSQEIAVRSWYYANSLTPEIIISFLDFGYNDLNDKVEIQLETPGSIEMMEQGEELCKYLGFSKKLEQITDNDLIQALNIFIDFCDNFKNCNNTDNLVEKIQKYVKENGWREID